jgi:periplasmic divalent cation tolerance protein
MQPSDLMVGWTTSETQADAERLARGLVEAGLAACAQVSGPITSFYRWNKKLETAAEFRVAVKFAAANSGKVADWLIAHHPYEVPQWVAVRADAATKNYLMWVVDDPT